MAIPKVCGIENEFGFLILDKNGKQIEPERGSDYEKAVRAFVEDFLVFSKGAKSDGNKMGMPESLLDDVEDSGDDDKSFSIQEMLHRWRTYWFFRELDGFLENGSRFYLDDAHPEYCTPECLSPLDLVAHDKASELFMLDAQKVFMEKFSEDKKIGKILIHKNNCDDDGHSYGCHLNVLLSRKLVSSRDSLRYFVRHYMAFQISRMILIGGGRLGFERNRPPCQFQISQRADFFERLMSLETTNYRPIFNTRDEAHGTHNKYFRLHDISTDALMCETAIFLKVALSQVVLSMIEDHFLDEEWLPKNPVAAMYTVSRDLKFRMQLELVDGRKMTGMEILRKYLEKSRVYLNQNPMSPQHDLAVREAIQLLDQLEKDPKLTFGKLDWTTTLGITESRPAEAKINALKFREISHRGLYYGFDRAGKMKRLLDDGVIQKAKTEAPKDTRAYLRSLLVKKWGSRIVDLDWSSARLSDPDEELRLDNPLLDRREYAELLSKLDS